MPSFRTAIVTAILTERRGFQRVEVGDERAYVLTDLVGPVEVGDCVVMNTTAVDLGLGSGGWHVVHWNLARIAWSQPGPGHIMKLRYTSLQVDSGAAEEHLDDAATGLEGIPVVACTLHSQVPCVAAAFKALAPEARLVYVMTDGAALPMAVSDLVAGMRDSELIDGTITACHAFGGDLEAVSMPSALSLARHALHADAVVVGMGPGVVGTGSRLGTTAVEAAAVLDAASALGGRPVLAVRVSLADRRERQRGVSHHSRTVLDLVRSRVIVPVPDGWLHDDRHDVVTVEPVDVAGLLASHRLQVTTMGRGPDEDPDFFTAAGAAGTCAAHLVSSDG